MEKSVGYVVVLACRNEAKLIEGAIKGVLSQTIQPEAFVVVDDSSEDETPEIVKRYEPRVKLLKTMHERIAVRGVNECLARLDGVREVTRLVPDWEYLLKLDADSYLAPDYMERLLNRFEKYPRLGIASGVPYGERLWRWHACGGASVYRRECWDEIGGFDPLSAFDLHAILKAKMRGWIVASFPEIRYHQMRSWEKLRLSRWLLTGRVRYKFGFTLPHTALSSAIHMRKKPRVLGGLVYFLTYLTNLLLGSERPLNGEFYSFMRDFCKQDLSERLRYVLEQVTRRIGV